MIESTGCDLIESRVNTCRHDIPLTCPSQCVTFWSIWGIVWIEHGSEDADDAHADDVDVVGN